MASPGSVTVSDGVMSDIRREASGVFGDQVSNGMANMFFHVLRSRPSLHDLNHGLDLLHHACRMDLPGVLALLLKVPGVDVNHRSATNWTPLMFAAFFNNPRCVALLITDSRVNPDLCDNVGQTALMFAISSNRLQATKWLVALHALPASKGPAFRRCLGNRSVSLHRRFLADPGRTRHRIRVELGIEKAMAGELFAIMVLSCDGYFRVASTAAQDAKSRRIARFLSLSQKMPIELQMTLAWRVLGSSREIIIAEDSGPAFDLLLDL